MSATGIGAAVRRKEDLRFITGKGQYTDDVVRPGETRAAFVRSPHAHGKSNALMQMLRNPCRVSLRFLPEPK